jgi:hypothetical protein
LKNFLNKTINRLRTILTFADETREANDELRILMGRVLSESVGKKESYRSLADLEFKVFSQFGDDGIIQYLTQNLDLGHRTFIEFGVEDYLESNTRFLLQKDNWSGFVMDGSDKCIDRLRSAPFFWKHDLLARAVFVTQENIRPLLSEATSRWEGLDLLHIDIDGNDYWIWKRIDLAPPIVIVEYNSTFGPDRAITVPYAADFYRTRAHFSNLYWGASLKALHILACEKGYEFIGCNGAGNNAYFIRGDAMNERIARVGLREGFVMAKYRESRDQKGRLTFAVPDTRVEIIRGLPVFDVEQGQIVPF